MLSCRNCKFLTDVNMEVAPDRGWCQVWENWQRLKAPACRHCESKFERPEYFNRDNSQRPPLKKNNNHRFVKRQDSRRSNASQDGVV